MRNVLIALGALSDSDIDWLLEVGSKLKIPNNQALVNMGQPIDALYLLLEGQFGVFVNRQMVAQLSSGDIVGEMSLVDSQLPSATVTALMDSWVLSIPRSQLKQHLMVDLGFAARFYRMTSLFLSNRLRTLNAQTGNAQAGDSGNASLQAEEYDADEIAPDVLEDLALAASRFEWILKRLNLK
jgi:CRP/FNR family transcriptional regulator, cyclic AMP receptor protein